MLKLESIIRKITYAIMVISIVAFAGIMLLTICDIVLRLLFHSPIVGAYEIVERTMICGVFASFAYTQMVHGHVQITLIISHLPRVVRFIILGLLAVLSGVVCFILAYAAQMQAGVALSSNYVTSMLKIPLFPFYWVEVISMVVLGLTFLFDAAENFFAVGSKKMAEHIQSTWT